MVPSSTGDYFSQGTEWAEMLAEVKSESLDIFQSSSPFQPQQPGLQRQQQQPIPVPMMSLQHSDNKLGGPSFVYPSCYMYNPSLPTSLLMSQPTSASSSANISPSIDVIDTQIIRSPSPYSAHASPQHSPTHGTKRRASSLDSDEDDHDQEHEMPEGVERDGMIWGMRVEDYRALSARERKRVRNRISARTFRAKRKGESSRIQPYPFYS